MVKEVVCVVRWYKMEGSGLNRKEVDSMVTKYWLQTVYSVFTLKSRNSHVWTSFDQLSPHILFHTANVQVHFKLLEILCQKSENYVFAIHSWYIFCHFFVRHEFVLLRHLTQQPRCALGPLNNIPSKTQAHCGLSLSATLTRGKPWQQLPLTSWQNLASSSISRFFPVCLTKQMKCTCSYCDVMFTLWLKAKVLLKHHRLMTITKKARLS